MSDKEETISPKATSPKATPKLKNKVKLHQLHECGTCSMNFKSPAGLIKHKQIKHESNENKIKPRKKAFKTTAHSGVPANPKLKKAFQDLKEKLQKM